LLDDLIYCQPIGAGTRALLVESGLVGAETPVLEHATAEQVRGKHVFGVLPLDLAALAASVTVLGLKLTQDEVKADLPLEVLRSRVTGCATYQVEAGPMEVPDLVFGFGQDMAEAVGKHFPGIPVMSGALTSLDIEGKVVVGSIPLELAVYARGVLAPILSQRPEDRGKKLSAQELAERMRFDQLFRVKKVADHSHLF
jgi:hypothetical protein